MTVTTLGADVVVVVDVEVVVNVVVGAAFLANGLGAICENGPDRCEKAGMEVCRAEETR